MNRNKKALIGVLCVMAVTAGAMGLASCGHKHKYEWKNSTDGATHFQECKCGDKINEGAHIDSDSNAECDLCGAHIHNSYVWKSDVAGHWQECECGDKINESAHIDAKNNDTQDGVPDGKCDDCGREAIVLFNMLGHGVAPANLYIELGEKATAPEMPVADGLWQFKGWYKDNDCTDAFDFETETIDRVTTVYAKWENVMSVALAKDYSNYTLRREIKEEEYPDLIDVHHFKRTADAAHYYIDTSFGTVQNEYAMALDGDTVTAYYRKNEGVWQKSNSPSFSEYDAEFAFDFSDFSEEDFTYFDGKFFLNEEHANSAARPFFGWKELMCNVWMTVKDGYIETMGCLTASNLVIVQKLTDIGTTQITVPTVHNTVLINKIDRTISEGDSLDVTTIFTITEEGTPVQVTADMINLGGLNADSAVRGTYTVTLNYTSTDSLPYSLTATVTVTEKKEDTFADILVKDYSNVTVTKGSTAHKFDGNIALTGNNVYQIISDEKVVQYNSSSNTTVDPSKLAMLRLDLLQKLDASIFIYDSEKQAYVAAKGANDEINTAIKSVIEKTIGSAIFVDTADYSITAKVSGGYISEVVCSYSSKLTAAMNPSVKTDTWILSDIGTTDLGEIPEAVLELAGRKEN